jgi:hypothetical protein
VSTAEINLGSPGGVSPELLAEVGTILAGKLHGLPYLFARSSYGNELSLHFGAEREHTHPKLAGKVRGTYVLSVRGSAWLLRSGVKPVLVGCGVAPMAPPDKVKPFNVTALESGALIGPGATVTKATPVAVEPLNAVGLTIELSDGSWFAIFPTPPSKDDDGLPEPADWEVLTPDKVLRVGPGPIYSVEENGPRRI